MFKLSSESLELKAIAGLLIPNSLFLLLITE